MEKWKIAVIVFLLAGFGGFQALQQNGNSSPADAQSTPTPTPTMEPKLAALIGTPARPWKIPAKLWMNTSRPLTPADLKGHITLIEFFRIGCSHCEDAVPFLSQVWKMMAPRQLKIISFQSPGDLTDPQNPERNWKMVQQWVKSHGITYPVAFDADRKIKTPYDVPLYPMMLVVDKKGNIIHAQTGHDSSKEQQLVQVLRSALS